MTQAYGDSSLLSTAAVTKPRAGSWEPSAWYPKGPVTVVGWASRSSPGPSKLLAPSPPPRTLQLVSLQDGEQPTLSRVRLYLLNAQCARAKNKTQSLSKMLSKFQKHWAGKMEPCFLLFLILHGLGL